MKIGKLTTLFMEEEFVGLYLGDVHGKKTAFLKAFQGGHACSSWMGEGITHQDAIKDLENNLKKDRP